MGAATKHAGRETQPAESRWQAVKRWTGIEDPAADAQIGTGADAGALPRGGQRWLPVALLLGLYGLAVLVYILLGSRQPLPQVAPDEYQYSALARSVADGNGLTYNGGSIGIRAALYIYAIAPAWLVTDSLTQSYAIAKAIGAFLICATVFPTWLLARRYVPQLVALIPAALMLAGTWMTSSGQMLMENLALPLTTASLAALVAALTRPASRWLWVSFGFALLATWSRAQLGVLIPVILLAVIVDIALQGRLWRERLRPHRWLIGASAAVTIVGGIVVLSDPSVLGSYAGLKSDTDLGRSLPLVGRQSLAFIAMSAVLPFIIAIAISLRRRAWGEDQLRPLLVVFWVTTIVLVIVTGVLSTAFQGVDWSIQRYVEYSLPVLYVLVVVGIWRGLVGVRLLIVGTLLVGTALLFTPGIQNIQEQRGVFGLVRRGEEVLGTGTGATMALLALLLGGATLLTIKLVRSGSARTALLAVTLLATGIVFAVQNQAGWDWQIHQARVWRAQFPANLSWIDAATKEPLARLVAFYNPFRTPQTEVFNRRINRTYAAPTPIAGALVNGFRCTWSVKPDGVLTFDPKCGRAPKAFYLNDDLAKFTFYDQQVIAQKPNVGRVVKVNTKPPAGPRLKAVVNTPCIAPIPTQNPKTGDVQPPGSICVTSMQGTTYLEKPGTIALTFSGGQADQRVQTQSSWDPAPRIVTLPAGQPTTVTFRVPTGRQQWQVAFDWQGGPPEFPGLTSAVLKDGTRTELIY